MMEAGLVNTVLVWWVLSSGWSFPRGVPAKLAKQLNIDRSSFTHLSNKTEVPLKAKKNFEELELESLLNEFNLDFSEAETNSIKKAESPRELVHFLKEISAKSQGVNRPEKPLVEIVRLDPAHHRERQASLHFREWQALEVVAEKIMSFGAGVRYLEHLPHDGMSFAIRQLHHLSSVNYSTIVYLRPQIDANKLKPLLQQAWELLGQKGAWDPRSLNRFLVRENILLVISNAHLVQANRQSDNDLGLTYLMERGRKAEPSKATVVLCSAAVFGLGSSALKPYSVPTIEYRARATKDNWLGTFQELTESFSRQRTRNDLKARTVRFRSPSPEGPRMKRLRLTMRRALDYLPDGVPISSLRVRAAAMSNTLNLSEADPTQGYIRLVSRELLVEDPMLQAIQHDIETVLDCLDEEQTLQMGFVSSGVHWFSKKMNDFLKGEELSVQVFDWLEFEKLLSTFSPLTYLGASEQEHICASLATRAVVQERWRQNNSEQRSEVHDHIARRLEFFADRHEDANLREEYPFQSPKEGDELIYRAEALRHFVRASETTSAKKSEAFLNFAKTQFEKLNKRRNHVEQKMSDHVLSRSEGRYYLKLELLHLLSEDGLGIEPFKTFGDAFCRDYHNDVGISRAALLQLDEARDAFDLHRESDYSDIESQLQCLLHLTSVEILGLKSERATALIEKMRHKLGKLPVRSDNSSIEDRITVREANLYFAKGQIDQAVEIFSGLFSNEQVIPITGDRAFACIDVFLAAGRSSPDFLQKALIIAEANSTGKLRELLPIELLRFDIRRARILNALNLPHASESVLENVCLALARHGGSARALHEFLLAAGETLLALGWPEWAYAGYLFPCHRRAKERGVRQAEKEVELLLQQARSDIVRRMTGLTDEERTTHLEKALHLSRDKNQSPSEQSVFQERKYASSGRSRELWQQVRALDGKDYDPFHSFDLTVLELDRNRWVEVLSKLEEFNR